MKSEINIYVNAYDTFCANVENMMTSTNIESFFKYFSLSVDSLAWVYRLKLAEFDDVT